MLALENEPLALPPSEGRIGKEPKAIKYEHSQEERLKT